MAAAMVGVLNPAHRPRRIARGFAIAARHDWTATAQAHLPTYHRLRERAQACRSQPMPEMRFLIRWPDGTAESCYSPALVVKDYSPPGEASRPDRLLARSRS